MSNSEVNSPGQSVLTPLAAAFQGQAGGPSEDRRADQGSQFNQLSMYMGARTASQFDDPYREIAAVFRTAGVFDLGWRGKIRITGNDRLRWLNGMVTNAVQSLLDNEGNYSFLLNPQGRILGDGYVYRRPEELILETSATQVATLLRHLDHYIIMDEVEAEDVSSQWTTLGLVGPQAAAVLSAAGCTPPGQDSASGNARLFAGLIGGVEVIVTQAHSILVPRYEIWMPPSEVLPVWESLKRSGAVSVGLKAVESLRVLEGTPLYGIDLSDRDLPQEANQPQALNFTKGCYLGQEIVERIRSRGKVHRQLRQLQLNGAAPPVPFPLQRAGEVVGQVTSAVSVSTPFLAGDYALGILRDDPLRKDPIEYQGGGATLLEKPPALGHAGG